MKIYRILIIIAFICFFIIGSKPSVAFTLSNFGFESPETIPACNDMMEANSDRNWSSIPDSQLPGSSGLSNSNFRGAEISVLKDEVTEEDKTRFINSVLPEIIDQLGASETIANQTVDLLIETSDLLSIDEDTGNWKIVKNETIDDAIEEAQEIISNIDELKESLKIEEIEDIQTIEGLFTVRELIEEGKIEKENLSEEYSPEAIEAIAYLKQKNLTKSEIEEKLNPLSDEEILKIAESDLISENVESSMVNILIEKLRTLSNKTILDTQKVDLTLQTLGVLTNRYNEKLGNDTLNEEIDLVLNFLNTSHAEDFASNSFFLLWDIWAWSLEKEEIDISQSVKENIINTGLDFVEKAFNSESTADYLGNTFKMLNLGLQDEDFVNNKLTQKIVDKTIDFLKIVHVQDGQIDDAVIKNAFKVLTNAINSTERFKEYKSDEIIDLSLKFLNSKLTEESLRYVCDTLDNFPKDAYLNTFLERFLSLDKQGKMKKISFLIDLLGDERGVIDSKILTILETIFEDTAIDIDREGILDSLLEKYTQLKIDYPDDSDGLSEDSGEISDAITRRSLAACIATIARLNEDWKDKVSQELKLSGISQNVWQEYGILMIDSTRKFDNQEESELDLLQAVMNCVPKELLEGVKVIGASNANENPDWLDNAAAFALSGGIMGVHYLPSSLGADMYIQYFLHELGHMIDFEILNQEQKEKFETLHESSKDIMDYARPYGMYSKEEDFATCFEAFVTAPIANLARAKALKKGKYGEEYLNKMLFMKKLLTDRSGETHFVSLPILNDEGVQAGTVDVKSLTDNFSTQTYLRLGLAYERIAYELTTEEFLNELENGGVDLNVSEEKVSKLRAHAIDYFKEIKLDEQNPEPYYFAQFHIGEFYRKEGKYSQALEYYDKISNGSEIYKEVADSIDKIQRTLICNEFFMPALEVYKKLGWQELKQGVYYLQKDNEENTEVYIHVRDNAEFSTIDLNRFWGKNTNPVDFELILEPQIPFEAVDIKLGNQVISYDPRDGKVLFPLGSAGKKGYLYLTHGSLP